MIRRGIFVVILLLCVASFASAQYTGVLTGTVRDSQGLAIPGVTVSATSPALIGERVVVTAADGTYRVPALPPGTYTLTFALSGFATVNREGVVLPTQTTITINTTMQVATVAETITVTGESPVVDVKTTRVGVTFGETELYDVPSSTDVWAVLSQSPGVRMRGFDVGGSHKSQQSNFESFGIRGQNRVTSEGVNSTENAGGAGFYYDYYSVEEFQVGAVGSDVEQDTPGGNIAMVVKSGGNGLSSLFNLEYQPESFVSDNLDGDLEARGGSSAPVLLFWEAHIDAGGPIVKDKAWFYGGYNYFKIDRQISSVPREIATDVGLFDAVFAKLNFQLGDKDSFIGYGQWQLKQKPFRDLSLTSPPGTTGPQSSWGWVYKGEHQRVWNDRMFTKAMVGLFGYAFPQVPEPGVTYDKNPPRIDLATQIRSGAYWESFLIHYIKPQVNAQIQYYLPDAAGNHDFKFGFDWQNDGRDFGRNGASGPIRYRDNSNNGSPPPGAADPGQRGAVSEIEFSSAPVIAADRNNNLAIYGQDIWTLNDRMTLNLGFRTGRQHFYYNDAERAPLLCDLYPDSCFFDTSPVPGGDILTWSNVALRGGVTFDLTGEGRSVLKFHAGRYYISGGYGSRFEADPASTSYQRYQFLDPNGNGLYDGPQELGTRLTNTGGAATAVDQSTKQGYADEYSVSVEHEIAADTGFRFTYVRKQDRNDSQTFDILRANNITKPWTITCNGCPGQFAGSTLNVFDLADQFRGQTDQVYANTLGNTDQNWDTLQFGLTRRFRGNFFVQTGFTYQWRDELRDPSEISTSPLNVDPIAVDWQIDYYRDQTIRQRNTNWDFRFLARYVLPQDVGVAISWRTQSGWPWAPVYRPRLPNAGTVSMFLEPIENNRSDTVTQIDFRLDKSFRFGSPWGGNGHNFQVQLNIMNLLNSNPETNFIMTTGGSYNDIIEWLPGRTFKIGLRYQF